MRSRRTHTIELWELIVWQSLAQSPKACHSRGFKFFWACPNHGVVLATKQFFWRNQLIPFTWQSERHSQAQKTKLNDWELRICPGITPIAPLPLGREELGVDPFRPKPFANCDLVCGSSGGSAAQSVFLASQRRFYRPWWRFAVYVKVHMSKLRPEYADDQKAWRSKQ